MLSNILSISVVKSRISSVNPACWPDGHRKPVLVYPGEDVELVSCSEDRPGQDQEQDRTKDTYMMSYRDNLAAGLNSIGQQGISEVRKCHSFAHDILCKPAGLLFNYVLLTTLLL